MGIVHVIVSGRVQGVGFRSVISRAARALGVKGTVQNLADGSVEMFAEGEPGALDALIERMKRKNGLVRIDSILVDYDERPRYYNDFKVLP